MNDVFDRLSKAIGAKSPIDIDGTPFAIWLIEVRSPRAPGSLHSLVAIGAKNGSQDYTGQMHLGHDRLDDTDFVVQNAIETIRQIVRGDLPPGTMSLL